MASGLGINRDSAANFENFGNISIHQTSKNKPNESLDDEEEEENDGQLTKSYFYN